MFIFCFTGRGVFAKSPICKGYFVLEYRGDIINDAESQRRKRVYHESCAAFMFAFKWRGKIWCIDASREDGSFGRLVNDEHRHPNCKMKKIEVNGNPHLCLFALSDIKEGEEITCDYGGEDCPWRTQVTSITASTKEVHDSHSSLQSNTQMDNAPLQTTTSSTASTMEACKVYSSLMDDSPLPCSCSNDQQHSQYHGGA
ncbi:N-lysine methyltransferase KMT5A-A-like [Myripristis murdjan]|uniref:N-lysine methyltransferase KMT5A-A-like n=1 Tax=Myripristis murdjan TaxID=586833 RepID=UPI0011762EC9|nr:N-lysine methyltransferase KMT5A-A-like [Myripristis murdjan]